MTLPHFAQSNRWTFAELRVEFFQEDPHFRNQPHQVSAGGRSWPLPPARSQSRAVFPLGQGRDALDWTRLDLRTSLPDIAEQTRMGERKEIASHAFVKIFDARIFTVPGPDAQGRRFTVGEADSGAYLEEGFYWAEKHLGKYPTRWTFPTARLRLPAHAAPGGMELRLSHFEPRRGETTPVRVLWNGRELACERTVSDGETLLTARLPADSFHVSVGDHSTYARSRSSALRALASVIVWFDERASAPSVLANWISTRVLSFTRAIAPARSR
jgi:hypothetical protein